LSAQEKFFAVRHFLVEKMRPVEENASVLAHGGMGETMAVRVLWKAEGFRICPAYARD
jgi:hypothetical protein